MPPSFNIGNLVVYRKSPALVTGFPDSKIAILLENGETQKVRYGDILFLHPGPLESLKSLKLMDRDLCFILDSLAGETLPIKDLSELAFGSFTPVNAWTLFHHLEEGLYFSGSLEEILIRSRADYERDQALRHKKSQEKQAKTRFIEDLKSGILREENKGRLSEIERFALGKADTCPILKELDIPATQENAHRLLLKVKHWNEMNDPYPDRFHFVTTPDYPEFSCDLENIDRLDLTSLPAYAIDDEGNMDPDDAISIQGNKLWVHIADVSSVVKPSSPLDRHALSYGATLYLPEKTTPLLPPELTLSLGLGLNELSNALSFCLTLNPEGGLSEIEIHLTKIRVTRLTYKKADEMLAEGSPLAEILALTERSSEFRKSKKAIHLSFPEVRVKVFDGKVSINPLSMFKSRDMVAEAMILSGEAAARFAMENKIPFPFTTQPPPESQDLPLTLADMFAFRKQMKPSTIRSSADLHAGLGLSAYSRATSPLRRYIDLLAHQQLRSFLLNTPLLNEQEVLERIGAYNAVIGPSQKLERHCNLHWTLVFLLQNPGWTGEGVVIEKKEKSSILLLPELALETRLNTKDLELNARVRLGISAVDLPSLSAYFKVLS